MQRHIEVTGESVRDVAALVLECMDKDLGLNSFRSRLFDLATEHGWAWFGLEPRSLFNHHARLLFVAVSAASYSAQRRQQLDSGGFALWVYHAGDECSEAHREFEGLCLPPTHAFWRQYAPPLGWECGCYIIGARSERAAQRIGGDPTKQLPRSWDRPNLATGLLHGIDMLWGGPEKPDLLTILSAIADGAVPPRM